MAAAVAPTAAAAPPVVENGDFEQPFVAFRWMTVFPPGFHAWEVDQGSVDIVSTLWTAASGRQSLDLNGNCCAPGAVAQTVGTVPGATYAIAFAFAGNPDPNPICPDSSPPVKRMRVSWGGAAVADLEFDVRGRTLEDPGWTRVVLTEAATASASELRFASLIGGACGPAIDDVAVHPLAPTAIDIKPGSTDNPVNVRAGGVIPVAVLSSATFDARQVRFDTACFGDADEPARRDCGEAHGHGHLEDVDGDGRLDRVLHFEVARTGIRAGDTLACLSATTDAGDAVEGCDAVRAR